MEILLDTCTLLYEISGSDKLPPDIKTMIDDPNNDIFLSSISLWEIEIKHLKNPTLMPISCSDVIRVITGTNIRVIDIREDYLINLKSIIEQNIHKDPFDHFLLSMARVEKMTLLTNDQMLAKYQGVKILVY